MCCNIIFWWVVFWCGEGGNYDIVVVIGCNSECVVGFVGCVNVIFYDIVVVFLCNGWRCKCIFV